MYPVFKPLTSGQLPKTDPGSGSELLNVQYLFTVLQGDT